MGKVTKQTTAEWRGYSDETPIGKWVRNNPSIPSRGTKTAHAVTNTDLTVHAYMQCVDGIGTRAVQSLIRIEFKSHGKVPDSWQIDTLFKEHCGINKTPKGYVVKGSTVINHGIYICVCSGQTPEESDSIAWGRFNAQGVISWRPVTVTELNGILRFDLHPKTLRREWLRRHHRKTTIVKVTEMPLGFSVEQEVVHQS
jgi:hypothetical protein